MRQGAHAQHDAQGLLLSVRLNDRQQDEEQQLKRQNAEPDRPPENKVVAHGRLEQRLEERGQ